MTKKLEIKKYKANQFIRMMAIMMSSILLMTSCSLLTPEPSLDRAEKLVKDGKIDEAIDMYDALLDDDEENNDAWIGLVEAYMEDEEWADAADVMADWAKIIEDNYDPDDRDYKNAVDDYRDLAADIQSEDEDVTVYLLVLEDEPMISPSNEDEDIADIIDTNGQNPNPDTPENNPDSTPNGAVSNQPNDSNTITIGLLSPLSGDLAVYGQAVKNGAELAVDMINEEDAMEGKLIELVVYDTRADATEAINGFNQLVNNNNIDALVGPVISSTSLAVGPLAEANHTVMITPTATNTSVTPDYEYVFRACYTDYYQGNIMAKFSYEEGVTKVGIIYNYNDDYSINLAESFYANCIADVIGYEAIDFYNEPTPEIEQIINDWVDSGVQGIYMPLYYNQAGPLIEMIKAMAPNMIIMGGDGFDGITGEYPTISEGIFYTNHQAPFNGDLSAAADMFYPEYLARYGEEPNALASLSFDATVALLYSMYMADSTEGEVLREELSYIDFDGVTGNLTFDSNGDPIKEVAIITIQNSQPILYTWLSIEPY